MSVGLTSCVISSLKTVLHAAILVVVPAYVVLTSFTVSEELLDVSALLILRSFGVSFVSRFSSANTFW